MKEPEKHRYTVFVVPRLGSSVERIEVSETHLAAYRRLSRYSGRQLRRLARLGGSLALVLLGTAAGLSWHYTQVVDRAVENTALREENLELRAQVATIRERVAHINETLARVKHLNANLQNISQLSDPDRKLAIAPSPEEDSYDAAAELDPTRLAGDLTRLEEEAAGQEETLRALTGYFEDRQALLASAPAIWPVRGWVTSNFGVRLDPYTAERVRHNGLDIASAHGTPIVASADGVVVYAGYDGGYGNLLVLDHGSGIKTRYAHLASVKVKVGERVRRGTLIATVGNTGRSTGPHLHYEVRVNGIPEDPRKFILETSEPVDPLRTRLSAGRARGAMGGG